MLVRDPAKRYTLAMVCKHPWMRAEVPHKALSEQSKSHEKLTSESPEQPLKMNDQVLRVMQSLGIDPNRTKESVREDRYDHHAAIYFLLQDRLSAVKHSPASHDAEKQEKDKSLQEQRRRPSSIAEQVALTGLYNIQPENLQSLREYTAPPRQLQIATPGWQPTHPVTNEPSGMVATEFKCLTCGGSILENTTSTTTCVKCARLRTRRRNFAQPAWQPLPSGPHDSRDSGVSSGSSQDYSECTPTLEQKIFPRNRVSFDTAVQQYSELARKLSEVEGIAPAKLLMKTSFDEGVVSDEKDQEPHFARGNSAESYQEGGHEAVAAPSISLPLCNPDVRVQVQQQPNFQPLLAPDFDRHQDDSGSPTHFCFREGRRASDGFVSNITSFQQHLYDKSKAHGQFELHQVREEHIALQNRFGIEPSELEAGQHYAVQQRISVPENFAFFALNGEKSGLLQQQLLQHRLLQKRQATKPASGSRRGRQNANMKPYHLPIPQQSDAFPPVMSSEYLFHPIAEDEPEALPEVPLVQGTVNGLLTVPACLSLPTSPIPVVTPVSATVISMEQDHTAAASNWQALPNYMAQSCRLEDASEPSSAAEPKMQ